MSLVMGLGILPENVPHYIKQFLSSSSQFKRKKPPTPEDVLPAFNIW